MRGRKMKKDTRLLVRKRQRKKNKTQNKRPIFLRLSNLIEEDVFSLNSQNSTKIMSNINHNPKKEILLTKKISKKKDNNVKLIDLNQFLVKDFEMNGKHKIFNNLNDPFKSVLIKQKWKEVEFLLDLLN